MNFGSRLLQARKNKGMSRENLAEILKTKGPVIGRYERDEITPSIEVAAKIANALEASLDSLTGGTSTVLKDKKERDTILHVMDSLLQSAQLSTTQQKLM